MDKLAVGMTVYLKPIGNRARYNNQEAREYKVLKVGRKYFEAWDGHSKYTTEKFHIDSRLNVTNYSPDWKAYISEQEILDEQEYRDKLEKIRKAIDRYGPCDLTLDQLRRIDEIITGPNPSQPAREGE